jgi:lipopolysaccharide export system protein LptA
MKPIPILFCALAAVAVLAAETNTPPAAATIETHITSDTVNFDLNTRQAVYRGHVRVDDPRANLTCEILTAQMPATGGRVDSIIAETNVVILMPDRGGTNRATGDKAVYHFAVNAGVTNETLELTGTPVVESPQGRITGEIIVWDRVANVIRATNQRMLVHTEAIPSNSIPVKAHSPAPPAATNTAPATP